jgi:hypothetical protein
VTCGLWTSTCGAKLSSSGCNRESSHQTAARHSDALAMTDLQAAVAVSAPAAAAARPLPSRELMSAREYAFLAARFRVIPLPSQQELARLAAITQLDPLRINKHYTNQRSFRSKKRKAEPSAHDEHSEQIAARMQELVLLQSKPAEPLLRLRHSVDAVAAAAAAAGAAAGAEKTNQAAEYFPPPAVGSTSAAASSAAVKVDPTSDAALNEELSSCLSQPHILPSILAVMTPSATASAPAAAGSKRAQSTRLETFNAWLRQRHIDPFSCARRCDSVLRLALLVEQYGSSDFTSFVFAGACVLQAAFEQCGMSSPASLSAWQALLADSSETARVSRQSDSLWYHVRRGGVAFCESIPAKAKDDTLTSLAIFAAVAAYEPRINELVSPTKDAADARSLHL